MHSATTCVNADGLATAANPIAAPEPARMLTTISGHRSYVGSCMGFPFPCSPDPGWLRGRAPSLPARQHGSSQAGTVDAAGPAALRACPASHRHAAHRAGHARRRPCAGPSRFEGRAARRGRIAVGPPAGRAERVGWHPGPRRARRRRHRSREVPRASSPGTRPDPAPVRSRHPAIALARARSTDSTRLTPRSCIVTP